MKRRALETVRLDPVDGPLEHIRAIVIEAEHEAAIDLDAKAVQYGDPTGIVLWSWGFLARIVDVFFIQGFKSDKYAGTSRDGHVPDERQIIRDIDRDRRALATWDSRQLILRMGAFPPLRFMILSKAAKSARSRRSAKNAAVFMAASFSATAVATNWFTLVPSALARRTTSAFIDVGSRRG
jgi:hypothetical protein